MKTCSTPQVSAMLASVRTKPATAMRTPVAVQRVLAAVAMEDPDAGPGPARARDVRRPGPAPAPDLRRTGAQLLRANERSERLIEGMLVLAESDRGPPGTVPAQPDEAGPLRAGIPR